MINDKRLALYDDSNHRLREEDKATIMDTNVIIKIEGTDKVSFRGKNKVIISGSAFTAAKHFNIKPNVFTPSYNTILGLENSVNEPCTEDGIRKDEIVILFAVGTDGCGPEPSQVFKVDYTKWIAPESLVPFRYQLVTNDLQNHMRDKYFGRKVIGDHVAYYFKTFETEPEFKQCYLDGTPIDENIYLSTRKDPVDSYVELSLKITKDDCRDFFMNTTGINDAKVNTISLLTAWKKEIDGHTYYQDIRPLTKINFPVEQLIDLTKGLDITYQLFY